MDNANRTELTEWVEKSAALLAPPANWNPNVDGARARFRARLRERSALRRYALIGATASFALASVLMNSGARALAQQLWQWIAVGHIEVVRVNFDSLPDEAKSLRLRALAKTEPPRAVRDLQEAASLAGFTPRLPRANVLSGAPELSVLGPMSLGTDIRTADLELSLERAGVQDETVPKEWDGARFALQIGSTVTAAWPESEVTLMQGLPPVLVAPSGFDLGAFTAATLRAAGMNREAARRFGHRMAAAPALLFGIGMEDKVAIREVNLRAGPATLIEDYGDDGRVERVAILWSVPGRVYLLSGSISAELATAVANAID